MPFVILFRHGGEKSALKTLNHPSLRSGYQEHKPFKTLIF